MLDEGEGGSLPGSCTIHTLMIILLVKLKNLDISALQQAWILIMVQQNSNEKCEGEKMVEFTKYLINSLTSLILITFSTF